MASGAASSPSQGFALSRAFPASTLNTSRSSVSTLFRVLDDRVALTSAIYRCTWSGVTSRSSIGTFSPLSFFLGKCFSIQSQNARQCAS